MRYLCLIYHDEKTLDALPKPDLDALVGAALDYDDRLRTSGHYLASGALQSVQTATTIRIRGGRILTTDGPFAETKEQLGGFILIEATDLDDAIRVASNIPPGRLGCVEVRPVMELRPVPRPETSSRAGNGRERAASVRPASGVPRPAEPARHTIPARDEV